MNQEEDQDQIEKELSLAKGKAKKSKKGKNPTEEVLAEMSDASTAEYSQSDEIDQLDLEDSQNSNLQTPDLTNLVGSQILEALDQTFKSFIEPRLNYLEEHIAELQSKLNADNQTFQELAQSDSNPEYVRAVLESYQQFSLSVSQMANDTKETLKIVNINKNMLQTIGQRTQPDDPNQVIIQLLKDIKAQLTPHKDSNVGPTSSEPLDLSADDLIAQQKPAVSVNVPFWQNKTLIQQGLGLLLLVGSLIYFWFFL